MNTIEQHNKEIWINLEKWKSKPLLQKIYDDFYALIFSQINNKLNGKIVELGSGIGNMKEKIPECITTDIFPNPWIDQTENAYHLSFENNSVSNIILFDVFHHLEFPGEAFKEFDRVIMPGGRVIIFDPGMGFWGLLAYGLFHHEPLFLFNKIEWNAPANVNIAETPYYAAQGNASRIFCYRKRKYLKKYLDNWIVKKVNNMSALSYVGSGGYKHRQLYPTKMYKFIRRFDKVFDFISFLFASRIMIVLEKK
jgi:SAM-dependent methyltransferase